MALSTEKKYLKYIFEQANKETPAAEKVHKYLQEVHGVKTPENFAVKLTLAHHDFRGSPFTMNLRLVDAVVEACEHWQEFVANWDELVCAEVLSMARIHTSVIHRYFLIKKGFFLQKQPSLYRKTTVTAEGNICFCNR